LSAAVIQAYHTLLMVGRFPITAIFLDLPLDMVDVNVHPTKAEIRFRDAQMIFSLVQRAVRSTLLGQSAAPHLDLDDRWRSTSPFQPSGDKAQMEWSSLEPRTDQELLPFDHRNIEGSQDVPLLRSVGQVGMAYLIAEGPDGIYLIDQHAAHERILYEKYMHELETDTLEAQTLLEVLTLEFPRDQAAMLRENLTHLNQLGFELEEFGGETFRLRSIPSVLLGMDPEAAIRSVVEEFEEDETPLAGKREAQLIARICKRLAIKAGQLLSLEEQRELIRKLEACASPRTCPHGRPTMVHLPVSLLARQFGRT
jgi:DNA mismatch repair protein MutL